MSMEKVFRMKYWQIYDALLTKMVKKNRNKEELNETIAWLTGYSVDVIENNLENHELTYGEFFENAPRIHPLSSTVKGKICGVDVQSIENELAKNMRILDKLVDELAKGKAIEKVLPKEQVLKENVLAVKKDEPKKKSLTSRTKDGAKKANITKETPKKIESPQQKESLSLDEDSSPIIKYIVEQDSSVQNYLLQAYEILKNTLPDAIEKISWGMPTFWDGKNIIHFAAHKKHLGIYPGPEAIVEFKERIAPFKNSKGAIQIPYNESLPKELLKDLATWCYAEVQAANTHKPKRDKKNTKVKTYEFDAVITPVPDKGGAYVAFPWNLKEEFGKGRLKVHATFDGEPYDGSVVNMGVKNKDGSICYILGIKKEIQKKIGKFAGDTVHVVVVERE